MERKPELSYFYCELYDLIYKHAKMTLEYRVMDRTEAASLIGVAYNIPKVLRLHIIKEMELAGWLRKYKHWSIELLKPPFNLTENPSIISKQLGLW